MSLSTGLLLGLLAMFGWGAHKIFAKKLMDRLGPYSTAVYGNSIFVAFLVIFLVITTKFTVPSLKTYLFVVFLAASAALGLLCLYKAMHVGKVSIVVPVSHIYPVVLLFIAFLFFGERLTALQLIAVLLAILGTIIVSFKFSNLKRLKIENASKGVSYALVTVITWGVAFSLIKSVINDIGPFMTAIYFEATVLAILYLPAIFGFAKLTKPKKKDIQLFLIAGIFVLIATLSYYTGLSLELISIVGPIGACALMVTVVLSWLFLKEKIEFNQKIAILMIFAGILMLALA